jgi:hypothetical protein
VSRIHERARAAGRRRSRTGRVERELRVGPAPAVAELQRQAGNAAVGRLLRDLRSAPPGPGAQPSSVSPAMLANLATRHTLRVLGRPVPLAAPPPDGAATIRSQAARPRAAGVTTLLAVQPPDLVLGDTQRLPDGRFRAAVQTTASGSTPASSWYPATGVHAIGENAGGQAVHLHVTREAAGEIREGEREHLMDMEWARHLSVDRAAEVVNELATQDAPTAATAPEARAATLDWVRSHLPGPLRWPSGSTAFRHWIRVYGQLKAVTDERDSSGSHDMASQFVLDPAAKRRLGVPVEDELRRYVAGSTRVGTLGSEEAVRARYDAL